LFMHSCTNCTRDNMRLRYYITFTRYHNKAAKLIYSSRVMITLLLLINYDYIITIITLSLLINYDYMITLLLLFMWSCTNCKGYHSYTTYYYYTCSCLAAQTGRGHWKHTSVQAKPDRPTSLG
jgi:hypothetical protein